jgi:hypothetical protein
MKQSIDWYMDRIVSALDAAGMLASGAQTCDAQAPGQCHVRVDREHLVLEFADGRASRTYSLDALETLGANLEHEVVGYVGGYSID